MPGVPGSRRMALAILLAAGLGGCKTPLMPTPNIYAGGRYQLFADDLAPELRTSTVDLVYVTDRAPKPRKDGHYWILDNERYPFQSKN